MLAKVEPSSSRGDARSEEWADVYTRSQMAADLLLDDKPGMLDMMVESTHPANASERPEITEEIKAAARALKAD